MPSREYLPASLSPAGAAFSLDRPVGYDPKDHFAGISKMVDAEQRKLPKQIEGFEGPTTES